MEGIFTGIVMVFFIAMVLGGIVGIGVVYVLRLLNKKQEVAVGHLGLSQRTSKVEIFTGIISVLVISSIVWYFINSGAGGLLRMMGIIVIVGLFVSKINVMVAKVKKHRVITYFVVGLILILLVLFRG